MEFEQGPCYAIYTMLGPFYTPGKAWKPLKSMEIPPKINPFGQCRSGQFLILLKIVFISTSSDSFFGTKKFPELLDAKYASFGGKNPNGAT